MPTAVKRLYEFGPFRLDTYRRVLLRDGEIVPVTPKVVDLLQVVVFPVVTGTSGWKPIYADWPDVDLELVSARTLDGRMQLMQYVPTLH